MTSSEKKTWATPVFITVVIASSFLLLYYSSNHYSEQPGQQTRKAVDYDGRPVKSIAKPGQVILPKNEKIVVGKNGLVFKGVEKSEVILDLYLLEMDPEQAYRKRFSKKEAKNEMILGGQRYRLLSANDRYLSLKLIPPSTAL
jgi:hypothetical protein